MVDILNIDQGNILQYNLYTYCLNNPVNREDIEGNISILACAALGGAVAGGIISAMSYAVSCSMNGQEILAKEMAAEILCGVLTGAIGGTIGMLTSPIKSIEILTKAIYSSFLGVGVGMHAYDNGADIMNCWIAGGSATLGIFAGALISTEGAGKLGTIFANYAIGLTTGAPAEIISTTGQQINSTSNVKATGKNSNRTQNRKSATCRISSGMTTADYYRLQYNS